MAVRQRAGRDWASIAAAAIGFVTIVVYLAVIIQQDTESDDYPLVAFVTVYFAGLSVAALASVSVDTRRCVALRSAAASGFLFWGLIAVGSIGIPLLIAGLVALIALIRTLRAVPGTGTLATVVATVTVLTGYAGWMIAASVQ